jgi:hypothetical protein
MWLNVVILLTTCALLSYTSRAEPAVGCNGAIGTALRGARQNGDALAFATLPGFDPLESSDWNAKGHGRKISVLVKERKNLNVMLARLNQHRDKGMPLGEVYGLRRFNGTDIGGFSRTETYFAYQEDIVTDIMTCNPPGSVPFPGCTQWIVHGPFSVQANYGRDWMPQWENIRNAVVEVIDRCGAL